MPEKATITLDRLVCFAESDRYGTSHSEPYIWPWLGILNGGQFSSTPRIATQAEARRIIKYEMRADENAQLPLDGNNRLVAQFDDGQTIRHLFLVVALLEADDLPIGAVRAGYQAYLDELDAQFRKNLGPLLLADSDEVLQPIVKRIKNAVRDKATSAIKGALTTAQSVSAALGILNRDDFINADFWHFDSISPTLFTLGFRGVSGDPRFVVNLTPRFGFRMQEFPVNFALDGRLDAPDPNATHGPLGGGALERSEA